MLTRFTAIPMSATTSMPVACTSGGDINRRYASKAQRPELARSGSSYTAASGHFSPRKTGKGFTDIHPIAP